MCGMRGAASTKRRSRAVAGFALLVAVITVLANLGADLLYSHIDPRIRLR